jgi:hypothetical protein
MRQMERATTRPKIVLRVFETGLAGNVKLDPAFLKKLPDRNLTVDEQNTSAQSSFKRR